MTKFLYKISLLYLIAIIFFIWGWLAVKLEVFPYLQIQTYWDDIYTFITESHQDSTVDIIKLDHQEKKTRFDYSGFKFHDTSYVDQGYLLISRYSKEKGQVVVELYSIAQEKMLHRWVPDQTAIFKMTPNFANQANTAAAYRSQHPLLMDNGDIVISSGEGPLVRIDLCGRPVWATERHFHHSIEMNEDGNLLVPIVVSNGQNDIGVPMRDDGIAEVSPQGEILREHSLYRILMDNGYRGLIYGVGKFETDRFHLNDVQPVTDGEVLLSIRNLSSIASLDINSGNIRWLRTGPWTNQHDVNMLPDGRVSIFGNDISRSLGKALQNNSEIYLYDPKTGDIETPFTEILKTTEMRSPTEGRSRVLANGDAFIEETNHSRLMRISSDKLRWEYVNGITDKTVGALHWSRYLEADEVKSELLGRLTCDIP